MNYTALEDRLFEEWKTRSRQCGDGEEIAPDGLLYRGFSLMPTDIGPGVRVTNADAGNRLPVGCSS